MGCANSKEEERPPPRPKTQEEYKAERLRIRAAIKERIMKPLQEFRFGTNEKEWERLPGNPRLDKSAEVSLHDRWVSCYKQPPPQSDDELREAIVSETSPHKSGHSLRSQTNTWGAETPHSEAGKGAHFTRPSMSGALSARSAASSWNTSTNKSLNIKSQSSGEDGGEVQSDRGIDTRETSPGTAGGLSNNHLPLPGPRSPSQASITSSVTSSAARVTKGQTFAARNSIMDKDLHTTGVRTIEHRKSIARFSNVNAEDLAGLTVSKRHTMTIDDYQAVETLPGQVLHSAHLDESTESKLVELQQQDEVENESRRGSLMRLNSDLQRRSVASLKYVQSGRSTPKAGAASTTSRSHLFGSHPELPPAPPGENLNAAVQDVWDEEEANPDEATLALILGDGANSHYAEGVHETPHDLRSLHSQGEALVPINPPGVVEDDEDAREGGGELQRSPSTAHRHLQHVV